MRDTERPQGRSHQLIPGTIELRQSVPGCHCKHPNTRRMFLIRRLEAVHQAHQAQAILPVHLFLKRPPSPSLHRCRRLLYRRLDPLITLLFFALATPFRCVFAASGTGRTSVQGIATGQTSQAGTPGSHVANFRFEDLQANKDCSKHLYLCRRSFDIRELGAIAPQAAPEKRVKAGVRASVYTSTCTGRRCELNPHARYANDLHKQRCGGMVDSSPATVARTPHEQRVPSEGRQWCACACDMGDLPPRASTSRKGCQRIGQSERMRSLLRRRSGAYFPPQSCRPLPEDLLLSRAPATIVASRPSAK